jgi:hypothetical protein
VSANRSGAERRLGEMIAHQKATVGLATGGERGGRQKIDGTRAEAGTGNAGNGGA